MRLDLGAEEYHQQSQINAAVASVPDAIDFSKSSSIKTRFTTMIIAVMVGVGGGSLLSSQGLGVGALQWPFILLAVIGGLLSTWSPCGYSSLSLLRPAGKYSLGSVVRWTPTFITHAIGYVLGAMMLGGGLGLVGWALFSELPFAYMAGAMAILALGYGAHQLGFMKMPYPQRRAQVPHDARFRFRSSTIGLLYGYALGMNYLTYVQTPILYIVTGVALLSGNVATAIAVIAIFNIGRCIPVAVNFFPISNQSVQAWLARWQESAVEIDGFLLLSIGSATLMLLIL